MCLKDKEKINRTINRSVKIVSSIIVSITMGVLTVTDFMNGNDATAWVNLISRITALLTSLLSGWLSGTVDVKLKRHHYKLNILALLIHTIKNYFQCITSEKKSQREIPRVYQRRTKMNLKEG